MGNTCCQGRPQQSAETNHSVKAKHSTQTVRRRTDSLKRGTTQVHFGKKNTLAPEKVRPKRRSLVGASEKKEEQTEETVQKEEKLPPAPLPPANSAAERTDEFPPQDEGEEELLEYTLSGAHSCAPDQRAHILALFASYRSPGEEEMDGYAAVTFYMNEQDFASSLLVSNKALYHLPPNSFQNVISRVPLETLTAMALTRAKDTLVLVVEGQEDWVIKSQTILDIAKAVQSVYRERQGSYLPALTFDNLEDISSWRASLTSTQIAEMHSPDNLKIQTLLVTKGEVGESKLLLLKCTSGDSHGHELFFLLSHKAIYTLIGPAYRLTMKIHLKNIDALSTEGEFVVVSSSGHEYRWRIPNPVRALEKLESAVEAEKLRSNLIT